MIVNATEFKTNIGKYLALVEQEEIVITKNGKSVAKLISARDEKIAALRSLRGIIKGKDVTRSTIREERLAKYDESLD
jgi:prevent-host-death family protein